MYSIELQTVFYEYQNKNHKIKTGQKTGFKTCPQRGTRVEKIRKIRSYDFNITKAGNKFYSIDHITANVINIY